MDILFGSSTSEQAVITNNGTLQIIDTSSEKTGTIENLIGTVIENNGTLTIGDNSNSIDDNTPTISGKKIGIKNNSTFNYYDGTIKGKVAIDGNVQATPEEYGPIGVYENGITTVNLRIISDYVARIDWFYYTTLQSAFDVCEAKENNTEQTTVIILKDIVLDSGSNVYYGQNIRLDLNGYTVTSLKESVITNYGKLEITDLTEEQNGTISSSIVGTSSSYYRLINNKKELIVSGGNIETEKNYNYVIYNDENGIINITGGEVSNSASIASYGIYNNGEGTVNVSGGTVSSNSSTYSYGIYNSGTVNVSGGTVSSNSSSNNNYNNYGIYNSGTVNVSGGTVSSNSSRAWSYGIYNSGTVNVSGGTVSSSSSSGYIFGINNGSTGTVNIEGGTVSSSGSGNYIYGINNNGTVNIEGGTVSSSGSGSYIYGINNGSTGTVNIEGGTVSSSGSGSGSYIYGINNNGAVNIEGGTVSSSGSRGGRNYGIYNSGTVNVSGGTVSSNNSSSNNNYNNYGIYNNGTVNVSGGTVSSSGSSNNSSSYGIYNSKGTITLGIKGDRIISNIEPNIKATYTGTSTSCGGYGIYNSMAGNLYLYDGIIQGNTIFGLGIISEIEEEYQIKEENVNGYNSIYLEEKEETYIVKNENTNKEYTSMQQAIDEANENEETTLTILKDFILQAKFEVPENRSIILNLDGNTITNKYWQIINNGELIIKDFSSEGSIICENVLKGIYNKGNLLVEGGIVSSSSYIYSYGIYNSGTVNVSGGTVSSSSSRGEDVNSYGIYSSAGTVNVSGGTVSSSSSMGSNRFGHSYGIYSSAGTVNVSGGTVSSSNIGNNIYSYGIYSSAGTVNVYGGTVSNSNSNSSTYSYGICNNGTVNVFGGTVSSSNSSDRGCYGIYNYGMVNVFGGTVSSSSSYDAYGIYNSSTGTMTLGTKGDGIVSNIEPNIKATYTGTLTSYGGYGIYNPKGSLYLYDGKIEGSTLALYTGSVITEREENTELLYEDSDKILTLTTDAIDIAKIGDTTYSSLQEAIDVAGTTQTTIELLRGIQYTNQDATVTITQNQDITLDLKGFSIISAIEDAVITNNGKLKITDTSENVTGRISSSFEKTIQNNQGAILELNKGTITKTISKDNVVYNEGTLNITGATVVQSDNSGYPIYNIENATLNITEGNITGGTKGIYNIGNANINGGTISNGITNTLSGILKIQNGTFSRTIENSENACIEMTDGKIQVSGSYTQYGIKNTSTNSITISGGTIECNTTSSDYKAYGIYSTAGTINIGTKDVNVDVTNPIILGTTNGIYSDCELNYYDGIIKGKLSAISGNITQIEEQCELVIETEEEYQTLTLTKVDLPIASVDGNTYYTLKEAINNITSEQTITILRAGTVSETTEIPAEKNVTIDLNGNTLDMYMKLENKGTLKITDSSEGATGILKGYDNTPINNDASLELLNGTISGNTYGIYNNKTGTTIISGGVITGNEYGIYNVSGGTVNITNGEIKENTYGVFNYGGTTNVEGGNITGNTYGVYSSTGTTNVTSGTISANTYGITNNSGTTNISNITITGNTNEVTNSGAGTINIISGTIIGSTNAITNANSSGSINIGSQDGTVNKETPVIQGEEYGINNSGKGTIAFYDGTIKGKMGAISGYYFYTETGYTSKTNEVDGYYCDTLALSGTVSTVAKIGDIEYTNLQSAINACTSEEASIITLVNSINTSSTFTIEEGQNVVIDLNGKTITSATADKTIQNDGTLKIIDSSGSNLGKITNTFKVAISNSGILTLGEDEGTINVDCPEISGNTNGVINAGTFNFYDGIIKGSIALDGTITSRPDNYVVSKTTENGVQQLVLTK